MAQNLSDMLRSAFEISAAQRRFVAEIAPKSPFLCVIRIPIGYDFRAGEKSIRYIVKRQTKEKARGTRLKSK